MRWTPDQQEAAVRAAARFMRDVLRRIPELDPAALCAAAWLEVLHGVASGWPEPDQEDRALVLNLAHFLAGGDLP